MLDMRAELLHIGFGGVIAANKILVIVSPDSAPVKRMIRVANDQGLIIDMTHGRKTKAAIVLESGHVVLAALQPETIVGRLRQQREKSITDVES
jgi:extracellular matrix regulatory protein A